MAEDLSLKLENWANINSYSYNLAGLDQMQRILTTELESLGARVHEQQLDDHSYINNEGWVEKRKLGKMLIATKAKPEAKLKVLLGGHMDTVYPPEHHFQNCRKLDANTLNGPGVADLKGGLIVMLEALRKLEASEHASKIEWTVFINPDEELGSPGSAPILEDLARNHDIGLVYEPSLADGSLAYRRMGTGNFTLVLRGKAAHVGRDFKAGRNAVVAAARMAAEMAKLNKDNNIILNIANIISEGPLNVVPDLALLRFNVRIADNKYENIIHKKIESIISKISRRTGVVAELHGHFNRKAKVPDERLAKLYKLVQDCARELGLEIKLRNTGGCCDGNNLWQHGLVNVDTLGVRGGSIHSDAEFVLLDSIPERIELSYKLLVKLAASAV